MMKDLVITDIKDEIGTLTLNNSEQFNSLTPPFLNQIQTGFDQLLSVVSVKVIILQATGKVFSTGGDVRGFNDHLSDIKSYSETVVGALNKVLLTMLKAPVPIIASVHGMVTGGSMGLVLASDMVLVTPKTSFTPYYSVVGFSPDGGWTAILPRLIGAKRAAAIMMLNETITAEQSVSWGITNRLVKEGEIQEEAQNLAEKITQHKTGSIDKTKRLLVAGMKEVEELLRMELDLFVDQIQTSEGKEGLQNFVKK